MGCEFGLLGDLLAVILLLNLQSRVLPSFPTPALCLALLYFIFFHLWDLYEEGNERKAGHSCCVLTSSHFRGSEQGRGVYFDSTSGTPFGSGVGGQDASLCCGRVIISSFVLLVPRHWGWQLKGWLEPCSNFGSYFLISPSCMILKESARLSRGVKLIFEADLIRCIVLRRHFQVGERVPQRLRLFTDDLSETSLISLHTLPRAGV